MNNILSILLIPVSSILWRIRGGMLNDITGKANWMGMTDTAVRIIYAVGVSAVYGSAYGWNWHVATLAASLFAACTIGWFGADIGLLHPNLKQIGLISASGLVRGAIISIGSLSFAPAIAGVLAGPICWLAARLPSGPKWLVWEEFIFGAAIGASLIKFNVYADLFGKVF